MTDEEYKDYHRVLGELTELRKNISDLQERLAASRQHSREWYELLRDLRRVQRFSDDEPAQYSQLRLFMERVTDANIQRTDALLVKAGMSQPEDKMWDLHDKYRNTPKT